MNIGDEVVCINDKIDADKAEEISKDFEIWVKEKIKYTIRDILDNNGIVTGILLNEIYNIPKYMSLIDKVQEPAFASWRFAKSQTNTASIEIAQEKTITV